MTRHEVAFPSNREGPSILRERIGSNDVRAVEELGMVTDLTELHEKVHERASGFCVADVRGLLDDVGHR